MSRYCLGNNFNRYDDVLQKNKNYNIIAVGYKVNLDPILSTLKEALKNIGVDITNYKFNSIVYAGIKYDKSCQGNLKEAYDTQPNMFTWYSTRKDKKYVISCDTLYVQPKLIIGKMFTARDYFYVFISNMTNDNTTTLYKKRINNGEYLPTQIEKIIIPEVEAYIYKK